MTCSQLKGKKRRPNEVVYSKKYISSVHGKIGQREKGSGNRTMIGQSGIRYRLRQEGKKQVKDCRKKELCKKIYEEDAGGENIGVCRKKERIMENRDE